MNEVYCVEERIERIKQTEEERDSETSKMSDELRILEREVIQMAKEIGNLLSTLNSDLTTKIDYSHVAFDARQGTLPVILRLGDPHVNTTTPRPMP